MSYDFDAFGEGWHAPMLGTRALRAALDDWAHTHLSADERTALEQSKRGDSRDKPLWFESCVRLVLSRDEILVRLQLMLDLMRGDLAASRPGVSREVIRALDAVSTMIRGVTPQRTFQGLLHDESVRSKAWGFTVSRACMAARAVIHDFCGDWIETVFEFAPRMENELIKASLLMDKRLIQRLLRQEDVLEGVRAQCVELIGPAVESSAALTAEVGDLLGCVSDELSGFVALSSETTRGQYGALDAPANDLLSRSGPGGCGA